MKKKKKRLMIVGTLAIVMFLIAGTFAWLQFNDERINRMKTKSIEDGSVYINEKFVENDDWQPGVEHEKRVSVTNAGEVDVFVRVSYEEMLRVYKNANKEIQKSERILTTGQVYVPLDIATFKEEDGWVSIEPTRIANLPSGLSENITVKVQVSDKEAVPPEVKTVAAFINSDGKGEKMILSLAVQDGTAADPVDWTYERKGEIYYMAYEGRENIAKDWAGENVLLGTSGVRYGVPFNYEGYAVPRTLASGDQIPHEDPKNISRWVGNMQADETLDSALYGIYDAQVMTASASLSQEGKWYYNEHDGYFYYLGILRSGETTPAFLTAIGLKDYGRGKYANMEYDLIVAMEAIQMLEEAVIDNAGWQLQPSDPVADVLLALARR